MFFVLEHDGRRYQVVHTGYTLETEQEARDYIDEHCDQSVCLVVESLGFN